jgi:glycosyltransferase involved in cell wall biosynthesis
LWLKRRQYTPLYLWVLDLWPESILAASNFKNTKIVAFIDRLVKYIYNNSDVILISSKYFRDSIVEKLKDKKKEVIYFPNWAEDVFTQASLKEVSVPDLPKGFNIMFAGNVGESQDFETVLEAAKLTSSDNINWIIVGGGRKIDWIISEIKEKKIGNIHLLGRYSIDTMPLFFKKADAMLVSLKDEPVFSLTVPAKIQAYMASGKVILGILNGEGNKLINESKCGFAVSAGDYLTLTKKALELKNMTLEKKLEMEYNSKSYYQNNFSKELLFDKLESLFKNSLKL